MADHPSNNDSLRAQARAYRSWANTADPSARTAPARAKFDEKFERQVDPDGTLPPAVRAPGHLRASCLLRGAGIAVGPSTRAPPRRAC